MLRNAPIRSKFILTLIVPLLALTVVTLLGLRASLAEGARAGHVNQLARFADGLAPVVHELQNERSLSRNVIGSSRASGASILRAQRRVTDQAAASYRTAASRLRLGPGDSGLRLRIDYAFGELAKLTRQRELIDRSPIRGDELADQPLLEQAELEGNVHLGEGHPPVTNLQQALDQYSDTVNDLLDINGEIVPGSSGQRLLDSMAGSVALGRAMDFVDLQRGFLFGLLSQHRTALGDTEHGRLTVLMAAESIYLAQFQNHATPALRQLLNQTVTGPQVAQVAAVEREAALRERFPGGLTPGAWYSAASANLDRLRQVELAQNHDIVTTSAAVVASAGRRALLYSLLLVTALVLAVGLSLISARSMIVPLSRLKVAADEIAERTLPSVVRRLRDGEEVDLAAESAGPVAVDSSDEIGQLAESFNAVHQVAVQLAGKEAALRRSIGEMFLNLARRSQSLLDRQLELLRAVPLTGPAELPGAVAELDHLASRMRRNAENLIVLSGADPSRRWRGPVPVTELLAAAVAEINDHTRVELLSLPDAPIAGHAAADVMHLLAELIENAVTFSAPDTRALVAGQLLPAGYLLEIEDQGIGMSDDQLVDANQRLAQPPEVDLAQARLLGFFVVGHLAARHGMKVQLRHSWSGGITALVLLPADLLARQPVHGQPDRWGIAAARESAPTGVDPLGTPNGNGLGAPSSPGRRAQARTFAAADAVADGELDERALAELGLGPGWFDSRIPSVHAPLRRQPPGE
ncbi:MAG TPA: nitrate- and nitrite sensing domain-containing protein [Actinomycetota bacterium]